MPERIIVFTMEKVGSSTVKWALEHAGYLVDRVTPSNWTGFEHNPRMYKTITMMRDPIAQMASMHFEYSHKGAPQSARTPHDFMVDYLPKITGIDVYKYYFDKRKGWQIYDERMMLIRTESLTEQLDAALTAFIGPGDYLIDHRAKGVDRFGPKYDEYLRSHKIIDPERLLDVDYVKHFYTDEEIEGFKQRWLKK